MKKGIAYTLVFALLLGMMLCVPLQNSAAMSVLSAGQQPDEMLTEAFNALTAVKNMHMDMDMTLDMNMIMSFGDQKMSMPMSILLNAGMDEQMEPLCFQGQMNLSMNSFGMEQTQNYMFYAEKNDGFVSIYSSEDEGANWKVQRSAEKDVPTIDPATIVGLLVNNIKDFENTGTELLDGTETSVYSGKLDLQLMDQLLEKAGAANALSGLTEEVGLEGGLAAFGDIGFTMYIDINTKLPIRYSLDMTDLLKNMLGAVLKTLMGMEDMEGYEVDVEIDTAIMECRMKDFNALPTLEVPEDVKAVAVEGEKAALVTP